MVRNDNASSRRRPCERDDTEPMESLLETAVDWCARSLQFGTDLIEYAKTAQENTFHMDEILFDEMMQYCKILVEITKDMQHKAA